MVVALSSKSFVNFIFDACDPLDRTRIEPATYRDSNIDRFTAAKQFRRTAAQ
jgi:hypothetical protein